jgi:hypothetical protein
LLAVSKSVLLVGQWTGGGDRMRWECSSDTDSGENELWGEREERVDCWRGEPGRGEPGS